MNSYSRRGFLAFGLCLTLPACSLPRGAPQRREILAGANDAMPEFSVYEVTRATLNEFRDWPATGNRAHSGWLGRHSGPNAAAIAPGDRLDLRIWDSGDSSLLTGPGQMVTEMAGLTVSPAGEIFLPYVADVRVAGMTPDAARRVIQERMESIAPSAQVQLNFASGRQNSIDLVSGVATPGRYPLEDGNTTVLGALSLGGGVPAGLRNPRVRLMRGAQVYVNSLARLYADPALDTTLRGGDRLIVEPDDRYFLALGAAGREEVINFTSDEISALRAISMMGGVTDARADPKGVLILRTYPASALRRAGGPRTERVVFSIDLTNADGLFSANAFNIHSDDVVLATESPTTSVQTIFSLLGNAVGLAGRVSNI